jgi:hypothetical protein
MEQLDAHGLLDELRESEDTIKDYLHWNGSAYASAVWPIAVQAVNRIPGDLEHVINQSGAPEDGPDLAFLFALFIYGREACDGAQIVVNGSTFGDHQNGLTDVRIEANAERGDFKIDVLVTLREYGPNPAYVEGSDLSTDKTVICEAALLKERPSEYNEAKLKRQALKGLGLTPVVYDHDEIERDPFALARRVIDDLARDARDEVYPPH